MYQPPFVVTANAIKLISEISALLERYAIRNGADKNGWWEVTEQ